LSKKRRPRAAGVSRRTRPSSGFHKPALLNERIGTARFAVRKAGFVAKPVYMHRVNAAHMEAQGKYPEAINVKSAVA